MENTIIKTENLCMTYNLGKSTEFKALKNVNIEIEAGEYVIFFGPSGCGKSTLLYCLAGMEDFTGGKIFIKNMPLGEMNHQQKVNLRRKQASMIFQAYNLIPTLNVLDNVLLPIILAGGGGGKSEVGRARELLTMLGVAAFERSLPQNLSGGQQQRVAIARALMPDPEIIYADEPLGNLDVKSAQAVMDFLAKINSENGKTIILVTHDPSYLNCANKVYYMKDGTVIREAKNVAVKQTAMKQLEGAGGFPEIIDNAAAYDQAKVLAQYLLTSLNDDQIKRLEETIFERICGKIDSARMQELFDLPYEAGGVGLYRQTAANFAHQVETIISEAEFTARLTDLSNQEEVNLRAAALRQFLLDSEDINLKNEADLAKLDEFIKMRLIKAIDQQKFRKFLDLPARQGGLGLDRRTASRFARKLELALTNYKKK